MYREIVLLLICSNCFLDCFLSLELFDRTKMCNKRISHKDNLDKDNNIQFFSEITVSIKLLPNGRKLELSKMFE